MYCIFSLPVYKEGNVHVCYVQDQVLLARSEHTSPYHAHFLLIPSSTPLTLLIRYAPLITRYLHDIIGILFARSIAVGEQLLPLELASGSEEEQLYPTKSSMDTIGLALEQVEYELDYQICNFCGKFWSHVLEYYGFGNTFMLKVMDGILLSTHDIVVAISDLEGPSVNQ